MSSAYFAASNGRAELAVKASKRLLLENTGTNGSLNTDKMVRNLLIKRNTSDPDCKLSPAEVVFGRKVRDTLPYKGLQKSSDDISEQRNCSVMGETWDLKEQALKHRYLKNLEKAGLQSKTFTTTEFLGPCIYPESSLKVCHNIG